MIKALGWDPDTDQAVYLLFLNAEEIGNLLTSQAAILDTAAASPEGFEVPGGPSIVVGFAADEEHFLRAVTALGVDQARLFSNPGDDGGSRGLDSPS